MNGNAAKPTSHGTAAMPHTPLTPRRSHAELPPLPPEQPQSELFAWFYALLALVLPFITFMVVLPVQIVLGITKGMIIVYKEL